MMKRLAAVIAFASLAVVLGSVDVRVGDTRFPVGDWTMRHWQFVPRLLVIKPACAAGFLKSSGGPCGGSPGGGGGGTAYTLTGPTTGIVGSATTNYTVQPVTALSSSVVVTPADATHHGTFTPATVTMSGSSPQTFTYTPALSGTYNISTTNGGGLTNPTAISFSISNVAATGYPGFTAAWTGFDATLATAVSDPFGGTTAAKLTEDTAASYHFAGDPLTLTPNQQYTISVYAKDTVGTRGLIMQIQESTGFSAGIAAQYDLGTCTFTSDTSYGGGVIASHRQASLTGGWCFFSFTGTLGAFSAANFNLFMDDHSGGLGFYTGNGTSAISIYAAVTQ